MFIPEKNYSFYDDNPKGKLTVKKFAKEMFYRVMYDEISLLSANLSYYFILSLFPMLIVALALTPYFKIDQQFLLEKIQSYAPGDLGDYLFDMISEVLNNKNNTIITVGIVFTLWSASSGIYGIIIAFNNAFRVRDGRIWIVTKLISVILTALFLVGMFVALVLIVFGKQLTYILFHKFNLDEGYYNYDNQGDAIQKETTEPYKLGSVNSKWNFGWKHDLSYKGFDLSFLFTARLGGIVISKTQAILNQYGVSEESALARDNGGVLLGNYRVDPKAYYSAVEPLDAYNVYSATNVRLQELRLSYNLPKKWLGKVLSNASLSMYATNLWMIYNKAPFDPELTASTGTFGQGYDNFMLPSQRTMGVSVKIGF